MIGAWRDRFDRVDRRVTAWMARYGLTLLRLSIGVSFIWFGAIKFVPGLSPADGLATETIEILSLGLVEPGVSRPLLALLECGIGLGLVIGRWMRLVLLLLGLHMLGTLMPLVILPETTWQVFPLVPTLAGQYIVKNAVLIAAGLVLGATVRGGGLVISRSPTEAGERPAPLTKSPGEPADKSL